jgi:hypothetical protein
MLGISKNLFTEISDAFFKPILKGENNPISCFPFDKTVADFPSHCAFDHPQEKNKIIFTIFLILLPT